ncbi:hypothetical protein ACQV5M_20210, partial [Leptospira sp. SA-E8]|uniref:hypothetical protein n=1 Tax=Leptospira sp. SA-E8 TaxID=3422259 RepID=UPI003EB78442
SRDWRALLPDALPEDVLLSLAHDFRLVEVSQTDEEQDSEEHALSLASAIFVVMGLLMQNPARQGSLEELTVSETGLARAMQCYQWGMEREIAARILGLTSESQATSLVEILWRTSHE